MEAAIVSRYTDLVELSQMILLALMLEILDVIPSKANMSVEVPLLGCVGSSVLVQVMVLAKPQGEVEGHTIANALVDGNVGTVGDPGKWIGGLVGAM